MTEHEYWDELAAGYALHGLAADEEIVFADHLESCGICAASMSDHEMVAAQLGSIAHYRETDGEAPSWDAMRALVVGDRTGRSETAQSAQLIDLAARRRRYDVSRRTLTAAAAVVVVAGGGIATWQLTTGGSSNCAAAKGCHSIQLDSAGVETVASVVVHGDQATMDPTAMKAAPAGEVYVLWQQPRDGRATPIGTFAAGQGVAPTTVALKVAYSDTEGFAVSAEKASDPTPSSPSNQLASGVAS